MPSAIRLNKTAGALVLAATLVCSLVVSSSAAAATSCVPKNNVELIIDDSGSMISNDGTRQRTLGMKVLLNKPSNQRKTMGAIQFGTSATTVFPPGPVASQRAIMSSLLDQQITANDGSTNYNKAFEKAKQDNPGATAWIFLTDGSHNIGPYQNLHQGAPPTYVIGFGQATTAGEPLQRLQQIATETGGAYFPATDANNIQRVINDIDALLNCSQVNRTFEDVFNKQGQTVTHTVNIAGNDSSTDVTVTWPDPTDSFVLKAIALTGSAKASASARRKRVKIKLNRSSGTTFESIRITRLKRGKLKFKLQAKTLTLNPLAPQETVTTQVVRNKKVKKKKKKRG